MRTCLNGATTMPNSLEQDVRCAAAAGFDGLEIWGEKLPAFLKHHSAEDARALLDAHHVKAAGWCSVTLRFFNDVEGALQSFRESARLAHSLGVEVLLAIPDKPPDDMAYSQAVRRAGEVARRYTDILEEYDLKFVLEPKPTNAFVAGPRAALDIVQAVGHGRFGLMMDTFHYYRGNVPLEDIEAIPIEKLFIVHVADAEPIPREELTDFRRLYPGQGIAPLHEMLSIVHRKGYDGYFSVEIFQEEYWKRPGATIAAEAKRHLDQVLAGLQ